MSGLSIQEAAQEAEKILKTFRSLEKLNEVLKVVLMSDQLIKERTDQAEALKKEIQNLSDQKALLVKGFDDDVYQARISSENVAARYNQEAIDFEKKRTALLGDFQKIESQLEEEHRVAMQCRQVELDNLLLEIEKNSKLLTSAQKTLDNLRVKLG